MRWTRRRGIALAFLAVALLPHVAMAQVVRGHVISARDSSAMAAVVLELLDAAGHVVGRTLSDDEGRFRLVAPSPGVHRIRTLRIGFRATTSEPLVLAPATDATPRIALSPVPFELNAVNVSARNACRVYADAGTAAELWDQARTAFTATRLSSAERRVAVTVTTYHRELQAHNDAVLAQRVDAQSGFTHRPWVSLSADSLRTVGYVVRQKDGWTAYYAPDLNVLASDVFLFDHCLRVGDERDGMIGIAFEPTRERSRVPEIAGVAWLDRRSYELRHLEFRYVNVSPLHRGAASGGSMDFLRIGKLWAISGWHIRMPVIERRVQFGRIEDVVARVRVSGGDLVLVRRGSDTLWARPPVTLAATLVDSLTGAPLRGARVDVRGTGLHAVADSAGRIAIPRVLPGVYTLRVASPDMIALGAAHDARFVLSAADGAQRVVVPTIEYRLESLCPALRPRHAVVVGRVVARGDTAPPANLPVFASWHVHSLRPMGGGVMATNQPRFVQTTTRGDGTFTLCDVPSVTRLSLRTAWNEDGPGVDAMIDDDRRVWRADLTVDPPRASLRGTVVDLVGGTPVADVEVVVVGADLHTRTDSSGGFVLDGLPAGTREVLFRRVGFMPVSLRRTFRAATPVTERVVLARALLLDSVLVRAQYSAIPGFDDRRAFDRGHAIMRDELARQEHRPLGEILAAVPGLRVLRGSSSAWASAGRGASTLRLTREPDRASAGKGAKAGCYSDVYLDGALIYGGSENAPLVDLNSFPPSTLEAVEYFAGPAQVPPEYNRTGSACGVVLLWSLRHRSR